MGQNQVSFTERYSIFSRSCYGGSTLLATDTHYSSTSATATEHNSLQQIFHSLQQRDKYFKCLHYFSSAPDSPAKIDFSFIIATLLQRSVHLEKCCSVQRQFPEFCEDVWIVDSRVASPTGEQLSVAAAQPPNDSLRETRESAPPTQDC